MKDVYEREMKETTTRLPERRRTVPERQGEALGGVVVVLNSRCHYHLYPLSSFVRASSLHGTMSNESKERGDWGPIPFDRGGGSDAGGDTGADRTAARPANNVWQLAME